MPVSTLPAPSDPSPCPGASRPPELCPGASGDSPAFSVKGRWHGGWGDGQLPGLQAARSVTCALVTVTKSETSLGLSPDPSPAHSAPTSISNTGSLLETTLPPAQGSECQGLWAGTRAPV